MRVNPQPDSGPSPVLLVALALLSWPLAGCDAGPSSAVPTSSRRDSAGVVIVRNDAPRWPSEAGWELSQQPTLEIGEGLGTGGRAMYQFNGIQNALRLPDGRIAIADAGSRQIRIFDRAGLHALTLGGQGEGPGEFRSLSQIGSTSNGSIGAWDGNMRRLTFFDAEGSVSRTTEVSSIGGMEVPAIGWFADGSAVIAPGASPMEIMTLEPGRQRTSKPYLRVAPSGAVDTLLVLAGREELVEKAGEGQSVSFQSVLFGLDSYAAVGPRFIYSGDSGTFAIEQRTPAGTLKRIIQKSGSPRPVSEEELERARDAARDRQRQMADQLGTKLEAKDPPARTQHPFFDRLVVGEGGDLWVRQPGPENGPQEWLVFDEQGVWLGSVETPAGLRVTEIDDDYVLGVTTDDLGVQRVRMYALNTRSQ